jgi:hypothetical protein
MVSLQFFDIDIAIAVVQIEFWYTNNNSLDFFDPHISRSASIMSFISHFNLKPSDTCQPYIACSSESTEGVSTIFVHCFQIGARNEMKKYLQSIHTFCVVFDRQFCPHVDTTCSKINTCKTCDTFGGMGGQCTEIDIMPVSSRNMLFVIVRVTQAATPRPRFSLDIRSLSITSFSVIFI